MGILNVTPDSFSDGGKYDSTERALLHAAKMAEEGAHIIDIGGESTRPGASLVSADEEMSRVIPVIERITSELDIPLSIDTYKASVADEAVKAGASILNDIWGAKGDPDMASVAAAHGVPIILMHNRMERNYNDLIPDMLADLMESVKIAAEAGVTDENMILDPGIGFAKNYEDNLAVMNKLEVFSGLGYPALLATSRKRFIGRVLDLPPEERAEGTGATVCLGVQKRPRHCEGARCQRDRKNDEDDGCYVEQRRRTLWIKYMWKVWSFTDITACSKKKTNSASASK